MSSSLEKAIEKARGMHKRQKAQNDVGRTSEPQASGVFRILSLASAEPETMERNKLIPAIEDRAAITAYKVLRTRVLQRMRSNNWRNLVVTSAGAGEGKTLTACNLAASIAKDVNQYVILVDLDLQRSSVAKYLGIDVNLGLSDFLQGNADIEDIVYSIEGMERIAIIPNRQPVENASDLIASPRMKLLMKWLKERSNAPIAIFDTPPILACDDVLVFLPSADALLLVTAEAMTQRSALSKTLDLIHEANLLGVVLNKSREQQKGTAYY